MKLKLHDFQMHFFRDNLELLESKARKVKWETQPETQPKVKRSGALGLLDRLFSRKAKSGSTCDNLYDVWPNSILFSWLCCRLDNILQTRQIKKEAKTFSKIINLQITAVACNTKNCFMRFSSIYSYSEMGHWDDFSRIHYNSLEM